MAIRAPMLARDPDEDHRVATPLELLFDLTFVVAIAQASAALHHGLVDGRAGDVLLVFPLAFFGIWWAWMNFTWFASAYDTDDVPYRLCVFVQMTGVLVLAAGIPRAFDGGDFGVMTAGYVLMRLPMVGQWLRAARADPPRRSVALRYATGIAVLQVAWVLRLALPEGAGLVAFVVLAVLEMAVPVWAEWDERTRWHPHHVTERYGLFTIIVLGESILSATVGVQVAIDGDGRLVDLATMIAGGLLIVFSMWWIYFDLPRERTADAMRVSHERRLGAAFRWGYGHYVVFASIAATGAGLAVAVDQVSGETSLTDLQAGATVTVPVALYVLTVWILHASQKPPSAVSSFGVPAAVVLTLLGTATAEPVLVTGLVLAGLVAGSVASGFRGVEGPLSGRS